MILLDVNVVLAALRDDHPQHGLVRPWFDRLLAEQRRFCVPDEVWAAVVRLATNRRVFGEPSPLDKVFDFARAVRAQPGHSALRSGPRRFELFATLCRDGQAAGDLVPDAFLASLAMENGCGVASLDRDFARFPGLAWEQPGQGNA
ncbi:MAG: type II toxin-antitoxin system VapC family toxin [Geodermatophilaceae bacterium]|nr:type II toxin-antitoxin system VapC family toxin [Geodermatophilaceae bacterium]